MQLKRVWKDGEINIVNDHFSIKSEAGKKVRKRFEQDHQYGKGKKQCSESKEKNATYVVDGLDQKKVAGMNGNTVTDVGKGEITEDEMGDEEENKAFEESNPQNWR